MADKEIYYQILDLIEELDQSLFELSEGKGDLTNLIHSSFRTAHSLKSALLLLNKQQSSKLIHYIENCFDKLRKGIVLDVEIVVQISTEGIHVIKDTLGDTNENNEVIASFIEALDIISNDTKAVKVDEPTKNKKLKILIVEDDYVSRTLVLKLSQEYGVCSIATNGKEALSIFKMMIDNNEYFDLILLDIMMAEMDGLEFLNKFRDYEESKGIGGLDRVKVLMTTALNDPKTVIKAFKDQCDGYLVKPIKKDTLHKALADLNLI